MAQSRQLPVYGKDQSTTYTAPCSNKTDTVTLPGSRRQDKVKEHIRPGNKKRSKQERGFPRKPVVYTPVSDGIGVPAIDSFRGKRWSQMLLFGKDCICNRLLRQAMKRISREGIQNLVIDVGLNSGGMAENVYCTLNYLTDKPIGTSSPTTTGR